MAMKRNLSSLIGDDNMIELDKICDANIHLKIESLNPAGSIKFKTAIGLITALEEANAIRPDSILIESSSGNLGVALSIICAERGYRFACVVDPNVNTQNVRYMAALGATIIKVTTTDSNGGFLGSRIACIKSLVAKDPRYIWINQYENPANPAVHAQLAAQSIDRHFPRLDYLFIGAGTCGTLMGCVRHIARARPRTRIIAVDSIGSVTFGLPAGQRYIPGLGSSQNSKLFRHENLHALIAVPEAAAVSACRYLARTHGFLAGGSTGTVIAGLWSSRHWFKPGDVVVAIAPDGGERYLETIYSDDWVTKRFGEEALVPEIDTAAVRRCVTMLQEPAIDQELQHV
jgi:2,3-diaminopropionate biosynthesis protein SbnA